MAKAISRVATELAKRKARSAGKFPKGKKGSKAVDARTSRYIKTPSGMKLNPERFKQKPLPKTSKLKKPTTAARKSLIDFGVGATAGTTATALGIKGLQNLQQKRKDKKTKKTKQMADEAYKKQKKRQKEYRQKKGGKGNR